jgi:hypothetical protein
MTRIHCQAILNHLFDIRGRNDARRKGHLRVEGSWTASLGSIKRSLSINHLVKDDSKGPNVCLAVMDLPVDNLRSNVQRGSAEDSIVIRNRVPSDKTKIG